MHLQRIESSLAALEPPLPADEHPRPRPERYMQVLVEVYDRGGRVGVSSDELAAIGARHGYDRRGLGGFFTGARAPLQRLGERVQLTVHGELLLDSYLAQL